MVSRHDRLLGLAASARRGQQPTFLFMGAVKYLLGPRIAELTPESFVAFCELHESELRHLLETRLVQTNAVPRSLALWIGMTVVAAHTAEAVHLVEVGASAGVHLRFDRFGYRLGGKRFGNVSSPVQIDAELRDGFGSFDLDATPRLASVTGIDLAPIAATDADQRRWLEALVWPENVHEQELLAAALDAIAADPPAIVAGDAVDVLPTLELPPGEPRVVFTAATRMHVPAERRPAFDEAIHGLGQSGPLYWISLERPAEDAVGLHVLLPSGKEVLAAVVGGRVQWVSMRGQPATESGKYGGASK